LANHQKLKEVEDQSETVLDDIVAGKWDSVLADKKITNKADHIVESILSPSQQTTEPATQTPEPATQPTAPEGTASSQEETRGKSKNYKKKRSSLSDEKLTYVSIIIQSF